jgi:hypothetical protein
MKILSIWAISRKAPHRIFSNLSFWKVPRVPGNTPSLLFLLRSFFKTPCRIHESGSKIESLVLAEFGPYQSDENQIFSIINFLPTLNFPVEIKKNWLSQIIYYSQIWVPVFSQGWPAECCISSFLKLF